MALQLTTESIAAFVRGSSQRLSSSIGLGWENIAVERHLIEQGDKPEAEISQYIITLASGPRVLAGHRAGPHGHLSPYLKPPGTMNVNVEGFVPAVYPSTQTDLIVCALNPVLVGEIAAEQGPRNTSKPRERRDFRDKALCTRSSTYANGCKRRFWD
jgi:AraC family transcriptional regulator